MMLEHASLNCVQSPVTFATNEISSSGDPCFTKLSGIVTLRVRVAAVKV